MAYEVLEEGSRGEEGRLCTAFKEVSFYCSQNREAKVLRMKGVPRNNFLIMYVKELFPLNNE